MPGSSPRTRSDFIFGQTGMSVPHHTSVEQAFLSVHSPCDDEIEIGSDEEVLNIPIVLCESVNRCSTDHARPRLRFGLVTGLHRDERGVISLLAVFILLGCTWLLLWLLNSAKQLDSKVRMQNAVDAAGQSGVGILARGMNAVAFANQLEADLLAAVAVMQAAQETSNSSSPLVGTLLPVFQEILAGQSGQSPLDRPIPAFRADVVRKIPTLADQVTRQVGRLNGFWNGPNAAANPDGPQGPLLVQLWTIAGQPVGYAAEENPLTRTLPVIDPSPAGLDASFLSDIDRRFQYARNTRERLVRHYIVLWAQELAGGDPVLAGQLVTAAEIHWRSLLNGIYRDSNLPMILRSTPPDEQRLELDTMFVTVAYRLHPLPTAPLMFGNPNAALAPSMAFSQNALFLPRPRFTCCPWGETRTDPVTGDVDFLSFTDGWPADWSANSQNWQTKLVPATLASISSILSSSPPQSSLNPAQWGSLSPRDMDVLTHH